MDIVPKKQFISLDTLETYIERYPEDAEKWLEFIKEPEGEPITGHAQDELDNEIYKLNLNIESDVPIEHYNDGCLFCKKSWASTDGVPTMTLICGHKFHTLCSMVDQYNGDTIRCIVDDCDIDTWAYVRKIVRSKEKVKEKATNILLEAYQKRTDFKADLKDLKENISTVTRNHGAVAKLIADGKKEFIHKHWYTLNQMQADLNEGVKYIKESEKMEKYTSSVREYRKKAGNMFRKYHMSFRELRERGLVRTGWRLRWVLERHRSAFSYYKLGFRMFPGKKIWKDYLEQSDTE
jgi:hypothetical protein